MVYEERKRVDLDSGILEWMASSTLSGMEWNEGINLKLEMPFFIWL